MLVLTSNIDSKMITSLKEYLSQQAIAFHMVEMNGYIFFPLLSALTTAQITDVTDIIPQITYTAIDTPYKLANIAMQPYLKNHYFTQFTYAQKPFLFIAGPCSIESQSQLDACIKINHDLDINLTRGGIVKPRTSPYSFQGLNQDALTIIDHTLPTNFVCEVMSIEQIKQFENHIAILQIGARNMQNFELLKAAGKSMKPVIIKRNPSATIEEWLLSAEYVLLQGNPNVILCERGIRTFETSYRNMLDINAIAFVKQQSHLLVIADPSHGTGSNQLVLPLALACVSAGADGLMIETHPNIDEALSDAMQAISFSELTKLALQVKKLLALR